MTAIKTRLADISHFQSLITLAFIKTHGIKGVAAKCTEGTNFFDPHYATNHSRTRSYGVPFWAYDFARPERSTADDAADYFLAHAHLQRGDRILMDAEASGLGQAATNAWLKRFADRCLLRSPVNGRDCYLSGGYCINGTGKGLAAHYERQWFPRYRVTGWAQSWAPGYPAGGQANTGWLDGPHVWQCSDRPGFDHDVSWLPIDQLVGAAPAPQGDDVPPSRGSYALDKTVPLAAGVDNTVGWQEIGDPDGFHSSGMPSVLTGPAQYAADYQLHFTGLWAGDWYELRVCEKRKDATGKWVVDSTPFDDRFTADPDPDGVVKKSVTVVAGYLPGGQHLHLEVRPSRACQLVPSTTCQVAYWKA